MTSVEIVSYKMKSVSLLIIALYSITCVTGACVPNAVEDLRLYSNRTLIWSEPSDQDESCLVTGYLVYAENQDYAFVYDVTTTSLDVSSFPACEIFNFTVQSLSSAYQGARTTIVGKTPAPEKETFLFGVLNITQEETNLLFKWSLLDSVEKCLAHYRVTYWDEVNTFPTDIETTNTSYTLSNAVPCMNYRFEVRGILDDLQEGPSNYTNVTSGAKVPSAPILTDIDESSTYVDTTWKLDTTGANRCPLSQLVFSSDSFNTTQTFSLTNVQSNGLVNVTLSDLEPNTVYVTHVYVTNTAGESPVVNFLFQTTSS